MPPAAQQVFNGLLRDVVAPTLREHGLRGSGLAYWLPDETFWAQVFFQKSAASTGAEVEFTASLSVTEKAAWDAQRREHSYLKDTPPAGVDHDRWDAERLAQSYLPKRPSLGYGHGVRIGHLIPEIASDHWWRVSPEDTSAVDVALDAVVRFGLPYLRDELGR